VNDQLRQRMGHIVVDGDDAHGEGDRGWGGEGGAMGGGGRKKHGNPIIVIYCKYYYM
jgi:hypothetical protein